jgi:plastocyanin
VRRAVPQQIWQRVTNLCGVVPIRIVALAACLGIGSVAPSAVSVGSGPRPAAGRIAGVVQVTARDTAPLRPGAYPSRRVTKPAATISEIANVIVYIADAPADPAIAGSRASIAQRDESFSPRVVAIARNSVVEFPNFDPFFHDVFSLSRSATFDLGRYPQGQTRERRFTKPGIVKVFCNIHSDMSATLMVFDHRLFAMPLPDGAFTIADVPAGTWKLNAWHERIGATTKTVHVAAGETARVEFTLPVVDPPR